MCPYCLFVDMINKQDCKYGDNCTFAYHQEEIDVWTEERKGTLNRDLLFDPLGGVKRGSLTIAKLLKEHQGIFTFLCEVPACSARSPDLHGARQSGAISPGTCGQGEVWPENHQLGPGDPGGTQILSGFSFYRCES